MVAYGHRRQGDCSDIETLIEPKQLDKASFIQTVNNIRPNGKTPISASLQHAADLLSYRDSQATIVLISDGLETCHADPCKLSKQLAKQGVKLTTHVVGFDLETKAHANLSCIAENTGGIFVPANNAAELHNALEQVQSAMEHKPKPKPKPEPTPPEVEILGPEQVTTGATFDVSWSKVINNSDFITLVPAGADEGSRKNHIRTKSNTEGRLTAPGEPGLYELRYVLEAGKKTLASAPIEVVEAEIGISGPSIVRAKTTVDVTWSSTINNNDFIAIVSAGADANSHRNHIRTKNNTEGRLTAPDETGLYELRYILAAGKKILARSPLEVVDTNAPLDYGAGLSVPPTAALGETITVSWTGTPDGSDQRIALALKEKPDFSWIDVQSVGEEKTMEFTLPEEAGLYEIRFLDVAGRKLLGRSVVEVKN